MALPRKSAQQVDARENARQKASDFTTRHEDLIELAAKFIEFDDAAQGIEAAAQEKAEKIIAQGKSDAEAGRLESSEVVSRMLETGESKSAFTARLGMSAAAPKSFSPLRAQSCRPLNLHSLRTRVGCPGRC